MFKKCLINFDKYSTKKRDKMENSNVETILLQPTQKKGLSVAVAAVFIVGTMCGSGILALPKAVVDSGWAGIGLLIICGIISSYTGNLLGTCWTIVRKRYPQYENSQVADPYPIIGYRAAGKPGQYATRICILITLFGGSVVFLLLIAGNLSTLIESLGHRNLHTCYWLLIITAVLIPFTWLGTPKDFWQAGILAAVTTTIGGIFIVAGLAVMYPHQPAISHSNPSFSGFFTAFGTILFAFGGASIFPTLQVDMENPEKFPLAVVIGIFCVLALYVSVSVSGFIVLGDLMSETNILDNMDPNWILYLVIILISSHLLLAFLIVINPVSQDLEKLMSIENKFSWKRAVLRTSVVLAALFVALSVPHFGVILSVVGGTTITATNFIFPPLFYILLSRQKTPLDGYAEQLLVQGETSFSESFDNISVNRESLTSSAAVESSTPTSWYEFEIPFHIKILLIEIIFIGCFGGIASTYSAIVSLVDGSSGFTVPCYINWATAG